MASAPKLDSGSRSLRCYVPISGDMGVIAIAPASPVGERKEISETTGDRGRRVSPQRFSRDGAAREVARMRPHGVRQAVRALTRARARFIDRTEA